MEKNGLVTVIFLFLILADFSEASLLSNFRKFVTISRVDNSNSAPATPVPSPSPIPEETKSNNKKNNKSNNGETKPQVSKPKEDPIPQRSNGTVRASPPPPSPPPTLPLPPPPPSSPPPQKLNSGSVTSESCEGLKSCNIQKDLVGCIKSFDQGSKELVVLVQNTGESNLTASLSAEKIQELKIPRKQSNRISVTLANGKSANISFNSGKNKCVIPFVPPVPEVNHFVPPVTNANFLLRFPTYDKLVTPVNGAYLLIFTALILGGTWACCKFRKRRRQGGGVPYQELEMGIPELESATNVETAEGWDQDWDDDWDEDNAVKSPGGQRVGSISANGLTSRAASKDGWEDNWDD
ncbi:hypothetical protein UlMin_000774 [Ulmus minor]